MINGIIDESPADRRRRQVREAVRRCNVAHPGRSAAACRKSRSNPQAHAKANAASQDWRERSLARWMLARRNARTKTHGYECTLTEEWVQEKLDAGVCERTGLTLVQAFDKGPLTPSIDKIEPGGGYTNGNCQMVCFAYNRLKWVWTDDVALHVARALVSKNVSIVS